jgi:predicted nucleic acid-binding protein
MTFPTRPLFAPTSGSPEFVLDLSVAIQWLLGGSGAIDPFKVMNRLPNTLPLVSYPWPGQMAEEVLAASRAGKVSAERADRFLSRFDSFSFLIDAERLDLVWPSVLSTARQYRLRTGPAAALELAVRTKLPLAAIDTRLLAAAPRAGVSIFTP